jgi:hypothetical protein
MAIFVARAHDFGVCKAIVAEINRARPRSTSVVPGRFGTYIFTTTLQLSEMIRLMVKSGAPAITTGTIASPSYFTGVFDARALDARRDAYVERHESTLVGQLSRFLPNWVDCDEDSEIEPIMALLSQYAPGTTEYKSTSVADRFCVWSSLPFFVLEALIYQIAGDSMVIQPSAPVYSPQSDEVKLEIAKKYFGAELDLEETDVESEESEEESEESEEESEESEESEEESEESEEERPVKRPRRGLVLSDSDSEDGCCFVVLSDSESEERPTKRSRR